MKREQLHSHVFVIVKAIHTGRTIRAFLCGLLQPLLENLDISCGSLIGGDVLSISSTFTFITFDEDDGAYGTS